MHGYRDPKWPRITSGSQKCSEVGGVGDIAKRGVSLSEGAYQLLWRDASDESLETCGISLLHGSIDLKGKQKIRLEVK